MGSLLKESAWQVAFLLFLTLVSLLAVVGKSDPIYRFFRPLTSASHPLALLACSPFFLVVTDLGCHDPIAV
jgi:ABC-type nitrate/sulfonate/bicarbonate transport system permease component